MDSPYFPLVLEAILADELQFVVDSFLLIRSPGSLESSGVQDRSGCTVAVILPHRLYQINIYQNIPRRSLILILFIMLQLLHKRFFSLAKIPIEAIKKLREETSAPLGQCKTALEESEGNHAVALAWLKQKGLMAAEKRVNKQTREGVIGSMVTACRSKVALVEVNCETDFVAKNELFLNFVNNVMCRAIQAEYLLDYDVTEQNQDRKEEIEAFLQDCGSTELFPEDKDITTLDEEFKIVIARLQQNIRVRRIVTMHSDKYKYGIYVHQAHQDYVGMQASIVEMETDPQLNQEDEEQMEEFGEFADNLATQVLGSPAQYLRLEEIPKERIEEQTQKVKKEMADRLQKAPEHTHAKIISGKLNASFYSECYLQKMPYILSNDGIAVEEYWKQTEKSLSRKISINRSLVWECK